MDAFTVNVAKYITKVLGGSAFVFSRTAGKSILEQILPYDLEFCLQEITKGIMDQNLRPQVLGMLSVMKPAEKMQILPMVEQVDDSLYI